MRTTCDVEGCDRETVGLGWCIGHNLSRRAARRHSSKYASDGTYRGGMFGLADKQLVGNRDTGCWEWPGVQSKEGYVRVSWSGVTCSVHRLVYDAIYGPIPEGMFVCHRCDNRSCVNPDHLWLGTHDDNMADMVAKGRSARGVHHGRYKHGRYRRLL